MKYLQRFVKYSQRFVASLLALTLVLLTLLRLHSISVAKTCKNSLRPLKTSARTLSDQLHFPRSQLPLGPGSKSREEERDQNTRLPVKVEPAKMRDQRCWVT